MHPLAKAALQFAGKLGARAGLAGGAAAIRSALNDSEEVLERGKQELRRMNDTIRTRVDEWLASEPPPKEEDEDPWRTTTEKRTAPRGAPGCAESTRTSPRREARTYARAASTTKPRASGDRKRLRP